MAAFFHIKNKEHKMTGNWILKVPTKNIKKKDITKILHKADIKQTNSYYVSTFIDKPKKEIKKLKKNNVKFTCYKVEFERASNYRQIFFSRTKGPYKCRYCNKKLTKSNLYVDHIIPVSKAQKTKSGPLLLKINGCNNVNDIKNLAPACKNCNLKKSDKMGIWVIRGILGKYKIYWVSLMVFKIIFMILGIIGASYIILSCVS